MLDKIVAKTEERLVESKRNNPSDQLKEEVSKLDINEDFPFKEGDILDFAVSIELREYQGQEQSLINSY